MRSVESVAALVGQTPLLEIRYRFNSQPRRLFAKYEIMNMTGSVKDRMALHILRRARERGELEAGAVICEATSGNTGISFSAIGRALGHRVRIYMPDWMSHERVHLMHSLGAEVVPVSKAQGGFVGSIALTKEYAAESFGVLVSRAFGLPNPRSYGSGNPGAPNVLRTGKRVGSHRIQGISDEFIPSIVRLAQLDAVVDVWDGDAILMSQAMCHRLGLGVGISAGANIIGAIKIAEELGPEAVVVTVICDSNKKYLSTALSGAEPPQDGYITPQVQLDSFVGVR